VRIKCLLFASFISAVPSLASAGTIDFIGMGNAEIVTVAGIRNVRTWAGELTWSWLDGKPAGGDQTFYSYCADLLNNAIDPQYNVSIKSTNGMQATWLDVPSGRGRDQITRTPEPATLLLLGAGFAGLATRHRKKSQA
jgi:PEP-CTERM motif